MPSNLEIFNLSLDKAKTHISKEPATNYRIYFGKTFDGQRGYVCIGNRYFYLSLENGEFKDDSDKMNQLLQLIADETSDPASVIILIQEIVGITNDVRTTLASASNSNMVNPKKPIEFGTHTTSNNKFLNELLVQNPTVRRITEDNIKSTLQNGGMRVLVIHNLSVRLFPQEITDKVSIDEAKFFDGR